MESWKEEMEGMDTRACGEDLDKELERDLERDGHPEELARVYRVSGAEAS
jgi:hypothetical protein